VRSVCLGHGAQLRLRARAVPGADPDRHLPAGGRRMITDLAPAFRPIDADLSVWRHDRADETLFYAPGYVAVVDAGCVPEFAHALETSALTRWPALDALREHAAAQ